jgi:hypothetical protein
VLLLDLKENIKINMKGTQLCLDEVALSEAYYMCMYEDSIMKHTKYCLTRGKE